MSPLFYLPLFLRGNSTAYQPGRVAGCWQHCHSHHTVGHSRLSFQGKGGSYLVIIMFSVSFLPGWV